jgi:hypothetical protein
MFSWKRNIKSFCDNCINKLIADEVIEKEKLIGFLVEVKNRQLTDQKERNKEISS